MALAMLLWGCCAAAAFSPEEAFSKANSLYAEEKYQEALLLYKGIIDEGWEAPQLYYNASNCHLRTGRPGYALVFCMRAARLAPNDDDIAANLAFIKSLVREGAPETESSRLLDAVLAAHRALSIDGTLAMASVSAFALAALLSVRIAFGVRGRVVVYLIACAGIALAVLSAGFCAKLWDEIRVTEAVVVAPVAEVRSGPGEDFVVQTSLGEGAQVQVKRPGGQWTEVELGPDLTGWMRSSSLEII